MSGIRGADNTGQAIAYLLLGVAGGLGIDLCAKALLADYSLQQFVFLRSGIALLIFLSLMTRFGGRTALATRRWGWHLARSLLACGATFGFFYALAHMRLVDALTLGYTAPLMMTALSALLPGEHVGWRRWSAVCVGFAGVLLMLHPGSVEFSDAAAACLFSAFCYACLAITARTLAETESSYTLSIYVVAGPIVIAGLLLGGGGWTAPDGTGWLLYAAAGACSVVAWLGLVAGYRRAPPSVLAPFEYTALVAGAIAGYLIWGEVADGRTIAGATIIVGSGLYVVYREVGISRLRREPVQPTPPGLPEAPPRPR